MVDKLSWDDLLDVLKGEWVREENRWLKVKSDKILTPEGIGKFIYEKKNADDRSKNFLASVWNMPTIQTSNATWMFEDMNNNPIKTEW